jgi:very-short-patch-repair endonuclease
MSYEPNNNFRVDYGFWNGEQLIAVEIDGAEPEGYARDIRRDRLLRRAGVDVIHILNVELARHKGNALVSLLPRQFFGYDWDYEGMRPGLDDIPF